MVGRSVVARVAWGLAVAGVLLETAPASAQWVVPSLDLRRWSVSPDPRAGLYLEPPATPGHLAWNIGARSAYAYRSIRLDSEAGKELALPIEHQVSVDYFGSIGLTDRLSFGVVLPTVVYQAGDDTRELLTDAEELPTAALGDLAFTGKLTLIPAGDLGGFSLAALGRVTLPTGKETSFVSEAASTGEVRLLGELSLVALALRGTGGVLFRGAQRNYADLDFGHELPWGAGIVFRPQILGIDAEGRWEWSVEARGALSLHPGFAERRESPALIGASARYTVGDFAGILGAEVPLTNAVGAPSVRAVLGIVYAPRFPDVDGDGIGDDEDECVELAEDFDGFEDSDGCPDFDNDDDGVPDEDDKCPREQEDSDGFQDEDGCPDPDNDRDGILDTEDKCPNEPGSAAPGADPGCPLKDADADGVFDAQDRCPDEPEDRDGHEDGDGCPDPDNDGDGVPDTADVCPKEAGPERSDPTLSGCPSPDKDGDTIDDAQDKCPDQPEDFDGNADADGCEDPGPPGAPLARWDMQKDRTRLVLARPLVFAKDGGVEPASDPTLRAIATLLNGSPDVVLLVAARPTGATADAEQLALNRSFEIVEALRRYTYRDAAAETIGWAAMRKVPGAAAGNVGFIVLAPRPTP